MKLTELDSKLVNTAKKYSSPVSRFALFTVYFWFGILKVFNLSPASQLIHELFIRTLPFLNFNIFLIAFGIFECMIGIMFLFKGLERIVIPFLIFHLFTTFMPLVLVPGLWSGFLIPSMEAQYIIKNVLIIALILNLGSKIKD